MNEKIFKIVISAFLFVFLFSNSDAQSCLPSYKVKFHLIVDSNNNLPKFQEYTLIDDWHGYWYGAKIANSKLDSVSGSTFYYTYTLKFNSCIKLEYFVYELDLGSEKSFFVIDFHLPDGRSNFFDLELTLDLKNKSYHGVKLIRDSSGNGHLDVSEITEAEFLDHKNQLEMYFDKPRDCEACVLFGKRKL